MAIPKDARTTLDIEEIPKQWYNIAADLDNLAPPLNPITEEPLKPSDLSHIFCKKIIEQECSTQRWIPIPDEVRDGFVALNRPSNLCRAYRLEKYLKTPAKIYFKREDQSPLGSHKGNSALAQAYYNAECGVHTLTTETGAGQWGTALSMVSSIYDIDTTVFMVKGSYNQKPHRKTLMHLYGAEVYASPSTQTEFGRQMLKDYPDTTGSLGIAITEACEVAAKDEGTCYALGSVLNHVMLHQTVIGLESLAQMEKAEIEPDYMIACVGGGSNFAGFTFPMMHEKMEGKHKDCQIIAVEPKASPSLTTGEYRYDLGDTGGMTPLIKMYTLGHDYIPAAIHAGGLRYHGMAPLVSAAYDKGLFTACAYDQTETFEAGALFAKTEGIIAAPESCHAIKKAIDLAMECKKTGEAKTIVFNLSGHGFVDLYGYESYLDGTLESSALKQ